MLFVAAVAGSEVASFSLNATPANTFKIANYLNAWITTPAASGGTYTFYYKIRGSANSSNVSYHYIGIWGVG